MLKKTERRRSRSRNSRKSIIDSSEFLKVAAGIAMIHDTMEYLVSTYGVIKVGHIKDNFLITRITHIGPCNVLISLFIRILILY